MGKMLGGDEEKDPDAAKKEEERQEALRQEEEERKAKYAKMEAEREAMRQGIRDKVGTGRGDSWALARAPPPPPAWTGLFLPLLRLAARSRMVRSEAPGGGPMGGEQDRRGPHTPGSPRLLARQL